MRNLKLVIKYVCGYRYNFYIKKLILMKDHAWMYMVAAYLYNFHIKKLILMEDLAWISMVVISN